MGLERSDMRVRASAHLAKEFGRAVDDTPAPSSSVGVGLGIDSPSVDPLTQGMLPPPVPSEWRSAKEVLRFLRNQGANVKLLHEETYRDDDWTYGSSDGEGDDTIERVASGSSTE